MNRKRVGRKFDKFVHRVLYIFDGFARKAYDNVGVYVFKSFFAYQFKRLDKLFDRVVSANQFKRFVAHGLGIDRDSVDRIFFYNIEFFRGNAVRSSGFNREFPDVFPVKNCRYIPQKFVEFFGI